MIAGKIVLTSSNMNLVACLEGDVDFGGDLACLRHFVFNALHTCII